MGLVYVCVCVGELSIYSGITNTILHVEQKKGKPTEKRTLDTNKFFKKNKIKHFSFVCVSRKWEMDRERGKCYMGAAKKKPSKKIYKFFNIFRRM